MSQYTVIQVKDFAVVVDINQNKKVGDTVFVESKGTISEIFDYDHDNAILSNGITPVGKCLKIIATIGTKLPGIPEVKIEREKLYRWVKVNSEKDLPKNKGSYITRRSVLKRNDYIVNEVIYNPKYQDIKDLWISIQCEWLEQAPESKYYTEEDMIAFAEFDFEDSVGIFSNSYQESFKKWQSLRRYPKTINLTEDQLKQEIIIISK